MKINSYGWILALIPLVASAETFYKGRDAQGNVIYSDKPIENGETITITPPPPVQVPNISQNPNNQPLTVVDPSQPISYKIGIIQPEQHFTYGFDAEDIKVVLALSPDLQGNDKIRLILNGKPYNGLFSDPNSIVIEKLPRGSYLLQAHVVDPKDVETPIAHTQIIIFYQKRGIIRRNVNTPNSVR